jgi:hypothetical protein
VELLIATAGISLSIGAILGILVTSSHFEQECEEAYVTGHVDGYERCEIDLGLHREADRHIGER